MRIFISRYLKPDSPFFKRLLVHQYQIISESLIQFSEVNIDRIPTSDMLFFYSKNAVRYAIKNARLRTIMQQRQLATMGRGTAKVLAEFGFEADFIGSGIPAEIALRLESYAANQSILFLRANNSRQSIQLHLPSHIHAQDMVVYNNNPKTDFNIPEVDLLVFTSPINAQAYFGKYSFMMDQQVLAIGHTTARALSDLGIPDVLIADEASEESLVDKILEVSLKN